jgi:3-phenylpropionate/cinnamic acid dioxygenase small subunit
VTTDYFALSQFLYTEAALLDAHEWDAWDRTFAPEGLYWVPAARDQSDPIHEVSLVYENALLRAIRLNRLKNADASSLQVKPNSSHLVSNIMLVSTDAATGRYTLRSRFVVAQYASFGTSVFHGSYTHELLLDNGELRIALKRVDLVNVDGPLGDVLTIL